MTSQSQSVTVRPMVYLAGPIQGLEYNEATDWRLTVATKLEELGLTALSPMRHKDFLKGTILGGPGEHPLTTQTGIVARDFMDVSRADALFVNFLYATDVSIGTCFELAWAYQYRTPVILLMEPNNIHNHLFIREAAPFKLWKATDMEEAISLTAHILLP